MAMDGGVGTTAGRSVLTGAALPRIPASAGALVWDRKGRLLILKPTYKSGWTIPGGVVEADGETPWEACRREAREECGLDLRHGRLACVDFLRPRASRPGGMRFLFGCAAGRSGAASRRRSRSLAGCSTSRMGGRFADRSDRTQRHRLPIAP